MECHPDTKVSSVIWTVVSGALAKAFRSAAFYCTVEEAVQKCGSEPPSMDAVVARFIDVPSFTVAVAKFIGHEDEKIALDKTKMGALFVKLAEAVEESKLKVADGTPTKPINTSRSSGPSTELSDGKLTIRNAYRAVT